MTKPQRRRETIRRKIEAMFFDGMNMKQICAELGYTRTPKYISVRQMKLKMVKKKWADLGIKDLAIY